MERQKLFGGDSRYQTALAVFIALFVCLSAIVGAGSAMSHQSASSTPLAPNQANTNGNAVSATPSISANYATSDGSTATVSSATLPDGGYIAVYRYLGSTNRLQLIGATDHVSAGTRTNVTVGLFDVPGRQFSTDKLNSTTYLVTRLHKDSNDNKQFDYPTSSSSKDKPYTNGSDQPVSSSDYLTVGGSSAGGEGTARSVTLNSLSTSGGSSSASNVVSESDSASRAGSQSTVKVKSNSKERTHYKLSVSGEIKTGSRFDTSNAAVPDTQTGSSVNGSVAVHGMDNLTYTGKITALQVSNDNADVFVDGKQVDPSNYSDQSTQSSSDETATSVATSTESSTPENESSGSTPELTQNAEAQVARQGQSGEGGSVTFKDEYTDGKAVTVNSATLPADGFVVLHGPSYSSVGQLGMSAIAVSEPLSQGTHENITLKPGQNLPAEQYNQSKLSGGGNYTAILYQDTNSNDKYDYLKNSGQDIPFIVGSGDNERLITDTANITVKGTRGDPNVTQERASISFSNQSTSGTSVTVDSVSLPDGGFVSIHNESYLPPTNNSLGSVIGASRYLEAGNHTNVEIQLYDVPGRNYSQDQIGSSQTLTAVAAQDVNANGSYDYITSSGQFDVGYLSESGSVVDGQAKVTVSGSDSAFTTNADQDGDASSETTGTFGNETIQPPDAEADASGNGTVRSNESVEIEGRQVQTPTPVANKSEQQSGGIANTIFGGITIIVLLIVLAGAGVAYVVIRKN